MWEFTLVLFCSCYLLTFADAFGQQPCLLISNVYVLLNYIQNDLILRCKCLSIPQVADICQCLPLLIALTFAVCTHLWWFLVQLNWCLLFSIFMLNRVCVDVSPECPSVDWCWMVHQHLGPVFSNREIILWGCICNQTKIRGWFQPSWSNLVPWKIFSAQIAVKWCKNQTFMKPPNIEFSWASLKIADIPTLGFLEETHPSMVVRWSDSGLLLVVSNHPNHRSSGRWSR